MKEFSEPVVIPVDNELVLRQATVNDAEIIFETVDACRDHVGNFDNPTPFIYRSLESTRRSLAKQNVCKVLGIWAGDELVGSTSYAVVSQYPIDPYAEIGWWVAQQHVGRGYGGRAANATASYLLEKVGFRNVGAFIKQGNVASASVAQKAGFNYISALNNEHDGDYWLFGKYREVPEELKDGFAKPNWDIHEIARQSHRSASRISLNGVSRAIVNHAGDTTYYVDSGEVTFLVDGTTEYKSRGDEITVPKKSTVQGVGLGSLIATYQPAFDPNQVEFVRPIMSTMTPADASV